MMQIRGAIFDMDGTLTDSMEVWSTIASDFLKSLGKVPAEDVDRRFTTMSSYEAVEFMQKEYDIPGSQEEIAEQINLIVEKSYLEKVPLKTGALEFLRYLDEKNIPMCVATATDEYLAEASLTRLGIRKYFKGILTSRSVGVGKTEPKIFLESARLLGTEPSETAVFEDSVVAIRTANAAGFITAAVMDESFAYARDEIKEISTMWQEDLSGYVNKI